MRLRLFFVCASVTSIAALATACGNPRSEAATAAALNDAASEIGGLKSDMAGIQEQLDSLRVVIAKQDTTIGRLADVAHVPVAR
jgi:septal ring factor EnvC (AmiA/AmiB activator)